MSLITDPTLLLAGNLDTAATPGAELTVDTATRRIRLHPGTAGSDLPLAASGVTGQALYSALKMLWRNSPVFIRFPFPMEAITPEQFEFINGWLPFDDITRRAIRTAGWAERAAGGALQRQYAGIISLGSIASTDQPYFQQVGGGVATNFAFTGPVNEAVQIFGDATNGNFDRRGFFRIFVREEQKLFASASLSDIGVVNMTSIVYRFPLANATDLNAIATDAQIAADPATFGAITITYFATDQQRSIGGTNFPFRVIINGNNRTAEQIYTRIQRFLRESVDIDAGAGTVVGRTADELLRFVGNNLHTARGVFIDNANANDINRLTFVDQNNVTRIFPFVAAGTLVFNPNLVSDGQAIYRMFFRALPGAGDDFGEAGAVIVNDANNVPISGNVTGPTVPFSFNYDSNVQGGRTAGTDALVTVVAIGLNVGQHVLAESTITRAVGQTITLVAPLERNFINP